MAKKWTEMRLKFKYSLNRVFKCRKWYTEYEAWTKHWNKGLQIHLCKLWKMQWSVIKNSAIQEGTNSTK
jgi:hypothetical protein